jgi:hypothetical protein
MSDTINTGTILIEEGTLISESLRVKAKTSRTRWPSRTRISSASSAFPRATRLDVTRYFRIGGRLHLVGSPIF